MIFTYGYLFYVPITIFLAGLFVILGIKKKRQMSYYFFSLLAVFYLNMAIKMAIFPILIEDLPEWNVFNNISLIPNFSTLFSEHTVLNMILTFPIGIGMQFMIKAKKSICWIAVIMCGAAFEICQLILLLVLEPVNIIFDINDLLSNILGAVLGMLLMCGINKYRKRRNMTSICS